VQVNKIRYLTQDDFNKFLTSIPKLTKFSKNLGRGLTLSEFQMFCKLLYYCALKTEEILSLSKEDFNLDSRILTLKESITSSNQTTIPPNLIPELESFLKNYSSNEKLFKVTRQNIYDTITEVAAEAGLITLRTRKGRPLEGFSSLTFRYSYSQLMLNNGADSDLADLKLRTHLTLQYGGHALEDLKEWEKGFFKFEFFNEEKINSYVQWYSEKINFYEKLAKAVENVLKIILESKNIEFHEITSRAKSLDSFENKIRKGINFNPKDMQDLAGVRVICYVRSAVNDVCKIIEKNFDIDPQRSWDKAKILGENKMGYASIHYVAKFTESRTNLEDFKDFTGIYFEIQVRTILQHAWAEIQHDKMYKKTNIPKKIKRRYYLVSGLLEVADNEFQSLHSEGEKSNKS